MQTDTNAATWFGTCALVAAVVVMGSGVVAYPDEMGPHVLATLAGVLGEAALVILVLDRITRLQERREWRVARRTVAELMAASAVDVMRLCGVRWSRQAYTANIPRYSEFVGIAEVHFGDLRSNLQALMRGVEASDYHDARRIEIRLAWLIQYLRTFPEHTSQPAYDLEVLVSAAELVHRFVAKDTELRAAMLSAADLVADIEVDARADGDAFWLSRMKLQGQLLVLHKLSRGIWFDIEGELAVKYFALDAALLERSSAAA